MDWTQMKNFGLKRTLVAAALVASMAIVGRFSLETARETQRLNTLNEGVGTCFGRVHQSFTARMLGDHNNEYLSKNFQDTTGRCFGEALQMAQNHFEAILPALNTLATDIHLFHERVNPSGSAFSQNPQNVLLSNLSNRFEKLENSRDQVLHSIGERKLKLTDTQSTLRGAFYVLAFSLAVFFILELSLLGKEARARAEIENEASSLLAKNDMSAMRVQEVLKSALDQKEYEQCSKLFSQFHLYKSNIKLDQALENYGQFKAPVASEDHIERVWKESDREEHDLVVYDEMFVSYHKPTPVAASVEMEAGLESLNLDHAISSLIDHLGDKIFTKGLRLEVDIDENLMVQGQNDALDQILYQTLSYLIDEERQAGSYLTLSAKPLGRVLTLEIEASGNGFSDELIRDQIGYRALDQEDKKPLELRICQELAQEMKAQMSFDNIYDDQGLIAGKVIRYTMKAGEAAGKRVQNIEKGTKRELMARLQAHS